ncbi:UL48 immediate early gene transactivator, tegument protein [Meleagrid alphaherpesvirus 1]|uniref:Alpha trans-inducing protein n=1 Tax=Meleagrid herpesvirus 1 TaxID=37108 RepID=Q9DHB7_MEHV1|nr:transactivating tegument protein VP16 [Meleagrid alphaherpesvirus 1]AKQ48613.1 transactivating tegument protein VP16 [iBAC vector pMeHV1-C7]AKQ48685.1 transactivating tegument protein VP16 [iBAC vector pMeHV1-C9]AKQ48757.1 transactivating tegument protein VP16 [iBAC vector pMeHV1-C10]AKQ48829.1 transactivating tegument protein VP16 [iBAC vector pMeHV1-C17]AKQ48902.1 transactivating tegument protein VP16 [iBAC vector pMeHV1-C18]
MSISNNFYSPKQLFSEIEAYANAMRCFADPVARESTENFNDAIPPAFGGEAIDYTTPIIAPFSEKLSLPSPEAASPNLLYDRLILELDFAEGPSLLAKLERVNVDLFSCLPLNSHLYKHAKILSTCPREVLDAVYENTWQYTALNLNEHGKSSIPPVPASKDDLPAYVTAVQEFYLEELEAREQIYAKLFFGYCRALIMHIIKSVLNESRGVRVSDDYVQNKARWYISNNYYRDAVRIAKLLYLHLYLSTTRDVSQRLEAMQTSHQDLFVYLRCEWGQGRQFWCIFQPMIYNHGVPMIEGRALTSLELGSSNYIRSELGLPLIRCELLEELESPVVFPPTFTATAPRSSGYLFHNIRAKMELYSNIHPSVPQLSGLSDHTYVRLTHVPVNYGTTVEVLLVDASDPDSILPGDPVPPLMLTTV